MDFSRIALQIQSKANAIAALDGNPVRLGQVFYTHASGNEYTCQSTATDGSAVSMTVTVNTDEGWTVSNGSYAGMNSEQKLHMTSENAP